MIQAAKLRNRLMLQVPIRSRTAQGGFTVDWANLREIYCEIREKDHRGSKFGGNEENFAGKTRADCTHIIVCRCQPECITPDMRFKEAIYHQNLPQYRIFNIIECVMTGNIRDEIKISAIEQLTTDETMAAYNVMFNDDGYSVLTDSSVYGGVLI